MNLVIFGASGGTGRALEQALDRGHTVTGFVRNASRMRIKHGRLRLAIGMCSTMAWSKLPSPDRTQSSQRSATNDG
jgi:nucleoside-diphosphate-sugar epimerase